MRAALARCTVSAAVMSATPPRAEVLEVDAPDGRDDDACARSVFELFCKSVGAEVIDGADYHTRAAVEDGAIAGRAPNLAGHDKPVAVRLLPERDAEKWTPVFRVNHATTKTGDPDDVSSKHPPDLVPGPDRIRTTDGRVMRVGFGGKNGHACGSVGQTVIRTGRHGIDQVSATGIASHLRSNPGTARDLPDRNPSCVCCRKIGTPRPEGGPIGAMGRSITPLRSVAINGRCLIRSPMVARDAGGAIRGMQRGGIFYGTGTGAGDAAGTVRDSGRMSVHLPVDRAFAMPDDA
ncbi:MAG: MltA domain-containing protein [Pseudomonadota bacterium]